MDGSEQDALFLSYEKLLNPQKLKTNLLLASLYLTAYEMMRSAIIDNVHGLFLLGGQEAKDRYSRNVLRLHAKDRFRATCLWVHNNGGMAPEDIEEILQLRNKRNQIAHELPKVISDASLLLDASWLHRIRAVVTKFDGWWIRSFEIDEDGVDPDTIPDSEIHSGNMILIDLILRTVDGGSTSPGLQPVPCSGPWADGGTLVMTV